MNTCCMKGVDAGYQVYGRKSCEQTTGFENDLSESLQQVLIFKIWLAMAGRSSVEPSAMKSLSVSSMQDDVNLDNET